MFGRLLYRIRNFRSRKLFSLLKKHCRGSVLDVGGWNFVNTAIAKNISFDSWTTLEHDVTHFPKVDDARVSVVQGDGCNMGFSDDSFDTVLSIQVLEHVFEPIRMVEEISRVLKPGGKAIFLIPQTSTTHLAPAFFQNMSRYWIEQAMGRSGLMIEEHETLGGLWSTQASHMFFFFFHSMRVNGFSDKANKRNILFYLLFPFMVLYALIAIPITLLFSLGDLNEEPNNHLVLATKNVQKEDSTKTDDII